VGVDEVVIAVSLADWDWSTIEEVNCVDDASFMLLEVSNPP
jgi:hypothetical protein